MQAERRETPEGGEGDLVLSGIAKSYGGVAALRGVDLVASDGEVHGLIGENGAGKSTLVKILSGSVQADVGRIRIRGSSSSACAISSICRSARRRSRTRAVTSIDSIPSDARASRAAARSRRGRTRPARRPGSRP